jgi:hypothetical protein
MNGAENWDRMHTSKSIWRIAHLFLQCKKLHSLVSQVGSNGYAKALHYIVPRERTIRQLHVLLIQETLHGNIVRHLVHKQLFYWVL